MALNPGTDGGIHRILLTTIVYYTVEIPIIVIPHSIQLSDEFRNSALSRHIATLPILTSQDLMSCDVGALLPLVETPKTVQSQ